MPKWAVAADVFAGLSLALGVAIMLAGGVSRVYIGGVRVSMSSPARAFWLGVIVLAFRHWRVRAHPRLEYLAASFNTGGDTGEHLLFSGPRPWSRVVLEFLLLVLGFVALIAIVTWPQVVQMNGVPDLGDPLFSTWRLAWFAHQIIADPAALFSGNIFYPQRLTLTYSDPTLISGMLAAPLIWTGVPQIVAYNVVFLSGMVFSGVSMFYLARALTGRGDAALLAAVMFAIYPFRFEHYSHLELQMTMWMPVTLWCLHRTMAKGRLRDGLLTGFFLGLQALSSLYFGVFLATFMLPLGGVLWIHRGRPMRPLRMLAAGAVVAAILTAPVAQAFIANKKVLGERAETEIRSYSAIATDYLRPHFRSNLYGLLHVPGRGERQLFPGVTPIVLAVVALWPPLNTARLGYALAMAIAFDGSLGLNGVLYPWLHEYGVVFRGLRVPARFSILVGLGFAVFAAFAFVRLTERWPKRRGVMLASLVALSLLEMWPLIELKPVPLTPPNVYAAIPHGPKPAVLAEFPAGTQEDFLYVYFSTFHWNRMLNGNSGFFPPIYSEFVTWTHDFPDRESMDYLRRRGVQYIVVHGAEFRPPRDFGQIDNMLKASPDVEPIASTPYAGSTTTLYRLKY